MELEKKELAAEALEAEQEAAEETVLEEVEQEKPERKSRSKKAEAAEGGEGYLLCEAAVDTGSIVAGTKSEPICELELELLAGDDRTLMDLGAELEARYGLVPGKKSKFARGKALRNGK
jgi:inorganic triphosphatase YgiF